MLKKGTMAYYSRLYDILYEIGQRVLDRHNPCGIANGKCLGNVYAKESFCCSGCNHLTKKGCKAKALWCKLWLCHKQSGKNPVVSRKLDILTTAASRLFPIYAPVCRSKREIMHSVSQRIKRRKYREKNRSPQNKT